MPREPDRTLRPGVRHGQQRRRGRRAGTGGQQRHPEAGRNQTPQGLDVLTFEGHPRYESGALAQLVDDRTQTRLLAHGDERIIRHLAQPHATPGGEAMVGRDREPDRLGQQLAPADQRIIRPGPGEQQIVAAGQELPEHDLRAVLAEPEANVRMIRAVGADQLGHQPRAQRVEEGKPDLAPLGIAGFPHVLETRVQLVESS